MKQTITISKDLAFTCATALVDKHNSIPQDKQHDNVILVSFRSLYQELTALGMQHMIASAIRPINERNLPLFI